MLSPSRFEQVFSLQQLAIDAANDPFAKVKNMIQSQHWPIAG